MSKFLLDNSSFSALPPRLLIIITPSLTSKMASRFAAVKNKEISQIIKQAVPKIIEEGDEIRFGSFNR